MNEYQSTKREPKLREPKVERRPRTKITFRDHCFRLPPRAFKAFLEIHFLTNEKLSGSNSPVANSYDRKFPQLAVR
jgi:hypothetical protein